MKEGLIVSSLTCAYQEKTVLDNISLQVNKGELVALVGLNGCGKTTLLKAINRLIIPKTGKCFADGKDLFSIDEKQRARIVSYIPQRISDIKGITVSDTVLMGFNPLLGIFESPSNQQKGIALQVLEKLGIRDLQNKMFDTLSEGQKQLVIIARTLVQNTSVILMDEPDSSLDYVNKNMILKKIRNLVHETDKSCLVSLHDPNFALAYCDRIIILSDKKIVSTLTPSDNIEDIKSKLSSIYGNINLLKNGSGYVIAPCNY